MLKILDLLDKKADAIGAGLEQIEARMGELQKEGEEGRKALAGITLMRTQYDPNLAARRGYKCKLGRVILMMGILGTPASAEGAKIRGKRSAYEGIQGLLENMAMGIKEKPSRNERNGQELVNQKDGAY
jgi:hypothetical protein